MKNWEADACYLRRASTGRQIYGRAARCRCVKCGEVYDSKNVQNQIENEHNRVFMKSSEPEYLEDELYLGLESFIGHLTKIKVRIAPKRKDRQTYSSEYDDNENSGDECAWLSCLIRKAPACGSCSKQLLQQV